MMDAYLYATVALLSFVLCAVYYRHHAKHPDGKLVLLAVSALYGLFWPLSLLYSLTNVLFLLGKVLTELNKN